MERYNKLWAALVGGGATVAVVIFAVPEDKVTPGLPLRYISVGGAALAVHGSALRMRI